jgi:uncharacterized membrane protein (DUF106 family)|tara:strand:+ start:329 stop:574 length:246 start_codon:yes stop_codon:yes gene_type:complete
MTPKYRNYKNANTPEATLKSMAQSYIESARKELKPHLKFIKTYVPIFPWLYQNLGYGEHLGEQFSMSLFGEKELPASYEGE